MTETCTSLISTAKYYTPAGKEIQETEPQDSGIKPTLEVRQATEEAIDLTDDQGDAAAPLAVKAPAKDEDHQLNKAIEIPQGPQQDPQRRRKPRRFCLAAGRDRTAQRRLGNRSVRRTCFETPGSKSMPPKKIRPDRRQRRWENHSSQADRPCLWAPIPKGTVTRKTNLQVGTLDQIPDFHEGTSGTRRRASRVGLSPRNRERNAGAGTRHRHGR